MKKIKGLWKIFESNYVKKNSIKVFEFLELITAISLFLIIIIAIIVSIYRNEYGFFNLFIPGIFLYFLNIIFSIINAFKK